jgi:hypothetical protein
VQPEVVLRVIVKDADPLRHDHNGGDKQHRRPGP